MNHSAAPAEGPDARRPSTPENEDDDPVGDNTHDRAPRDEDEDTSVDDQPSRTTPLDAGEPSDGSDALQRG